MAAETSVLTPPGLLVLPWLVREKDHACGVLGQPPAAPLTVPTGLGTSGLGFVRLIFPNIPGYYNMCISG